MTEAEIFRELYDLFDISNRACCRNAAKATRRLEKLIAGPIRTRDDVALLDAEIEYLTIRLVCHIGRRTFNTFAEKMLAHATATRAALPVPRLPAAQDRFSIAGARGSAVPPIRRGSPFALGRGATAR